MNATQHTAAAESAMHRSLAAPPEDALFLVQLAQAHALTALARTALEADTAPCDSPHLGLATTGHLLDEVRTRIEVHGPGLDYATTTGGAGRS